MSTPVCAVTKWVVVLILLQLVLPRAIPPTKQYRHLAIVYSSCIGTCANLPQKRNNTNMTTETFSKPANYKCGKFSSNRSNFKAFSNHCLRIVGCIFLQNWSLKSDYCGVDKRVWVLFHRDRTEIIHYLTKTIKYMVPSLWSTHKNFFYDEILNGSNTKEKTTNIWTRLQRKQGFCSPKCSLMTRKDTFIQEIKEKITCFLIISVMFNLTGVLHSVKFTVLKLLQKFSLKRIKGLQWLFVRGF